MTDYKITKRGWEVLNILKEILDVSAENHALTLVLTGIKCPCAVQQSMSSKSTPIMFDAIPLFEKFIMLWEYLHNKH